MPEDLAALPKGELITIIFKQAGEIEILKETIIELQEKVKQKTEGDDSSKSTPAPRVKANVKGGKKGKRKLRGHGFGRKPDVPTQKTFHSYDCCPDCAGPLGTPSVAYSRQVIDIPVVSYEVMGHVVPKRYCFNCRKRFYPQVNLSQYVPGKGRIGVNLMSAIFAMRQDSNMSIPQIQAHLKCFYQLDLSPGEIVEILHQEAGPGEDTVEKIKQNLPSSKVIYADETGGRENGINGYRRSFSNEQFQLLLYGKTRPAKVVKEVFGEDGENFEGVCVSDFYNS